MQATVFLSSLLYLFYTLNRHISSGEKQPTARFVKKYLSSAFFLLLNEKLLQLSLKFFRYHFISLMEILCIYMRTDSTQKYEKLIDLC